MASKIAVIGTGYVGLIQSVGLADFGNYVTGVDVRPEIVERLSSGEPTIFEHDLTEYLRRNLDARRVRFTTAVSDAVSDAEVVFIAVGTPENGDGTSDLSQIRAVVDAIKASASASTVVVTKSTVPVGTNRWISQKLNGGETDRRFVVASNPEFLREGRAIQDFFHPDRVVIGFDDPDMPAARDARALLEDIYRPLYLTSTPFVWTTFETAELIKYAANAFLATKITFINQMANLAEAVGADVQTIARTMGMDGRISGKFLHPGPGYGGSCFPKDTKALAATGDSVGVDMSLVKAVITGNDAQKARTAEKIIRLSGGSVDDREVAVLGLAFKAETDDIRESPAISVVAALLEAGATVTVHDPKALVGFRAEMERRGFADGRIAYHTDVFACITGAEAIVILTEWNEYRNLDLPRAYTLMHRGVRSESRLFDTRNVLDPDAARKAGFVYIGTGR